MASRDLRGWMSQLEAAGEFKRVKALVDWDDEISQVIRKVYMQSGPALLFENIKDHQNTFSRKLFTNGLGTKSRVNLMLGLPKDTPPATTIQTIRQRMRNPVAPVRVKQGPVKENIIQGEDVDLFQIPVPKWHPLDGGRYINTFFYAITRDPDTDINNAGIYRGMIISKNKIGVLMIPMKDWGITYEKYKAMNKPMPVAFVYGYDPTLLGVAGTPVTGPEYDLAGGIRQAPIELIKCETSDIEVPAYAEIVVEGFMSPDPATYEIEGPFGEGSGFYGEARKRPVVEITCITHRNDAIFRGALVGTGSVVIDELKSLISTMMTVVTWNAWNAMTSKDQKILMETWQDAGKVSGQGSLDSIAAGEKATLAAGKTITDPTAAEKAAWVTAAAPAITKWRNDAKALGASDATLDKMMTNWQTIHDKYAKLIK